MGQGETADSQPPGWAFREPVGSSSSEKTRIFPGNGCSRFKKLFPWESPSPPGPLLPQNQKSNSRRWDFRLSGFGFSAIRKRKSGNRGKKMPPEFVPKLGRHSGCATMGRIQKTSGRHFHQSREVFKKGRRGEYLEPIGEEMFP